MNYEEKRELRLQISQMLADAGLNQATIKEMVYEELKNKVDRAIDQTIKRLDANDPNGDYIMSTVRSLLNSKWLNQRYLEQCVKNELKDRVINVTLSNPLTILDNVPKTTTEMYGQEAGYISCGTAGNAIEITQ